MKRSVRYAVLGLVPFGVMVAAFQLAPLLSMITASFRGSGLGLSLEHYETLLKSAYYMQALKNSVLISVFSSLLAIVIGIISSYAITRFSPGARDKLLMISNMTSNFAGVPLAFAYIILLGNNGVFTLLGKEWGLDLLGDFNLYSWGGLVLVYVYFQVPLALLLLYPSLYGIRDSWKEAAAILGATKWQFWSSVGLPILAPSIFGTLGILFANSMGAYATAYALVGGNFNLVATRIGSLVAGDVVTQPELGSALAVLLGLTTLLAVYLNHRMARRSERFTSGGAVRTAAKRTSRASAVAEVKGGIEA